MMLQPQNSQSNSQMIGQAQGINKNLSELISVMRNAFPLSAFTGTFTCGAAASTVVNNANIKANSKVILTPTNAAAGTLQGSAKCLFRSTIVAGVSFTVTTASGGAAAGTETFDYIIVNSG
jgi:hypothetical protein